LQNYVPESIHVTSTVKVTRMIYSSASFKHLTNCLSYTNCSSRHIYIYIPTVRGCVCKGRPCFMPGLCFWKTPCKSNI